MEGEIVNNNFYDELDEQWYLADKHPIALLRAENARRAPWVNEHIRQYFSSQPCAVLDVGCGGGFLSNFLAKEKYQVTGIDLSEKSLEIAAQKDTTQSVVYKKGNAYSLPFQENSFDVVCAMDFLEHVEKPKQAIDEMARVLKPNGLFFFHTFNRNFVSWLFILKGVEWFVPNTPENLHVYRCFIKPKELKSYCSQNELKVQQLVGLNPVIKSKAFWKLVFTRRISKDFAFKTTSHLTFGYMGYALKNQME
ncbi:MAG: bifunctional 2-polyprenyl-6-hydroxyphenol methylase/3-demethylubiquinol 3-O-methyltransferase UbiG [Chlamydiales bacterium]